MSDEFVLFRDSIFNAGNELFGYALRPKSAHINTKQSAELLYEFIVLLFDGNKWIKEGRNTKKLFIPTPLDFLENDLISLFPGEHLVFELPFIEDLPSTFIKLLDSLASKYTFASTNTPYSRYQRFKSVQYSLIDPHKFRGNLDSEFSNLISAGIVPIIRGTNPQEQLKKFANFKVLYQGHYADGVSFTGARLNPSLATISKIINMLLSNDPDTEDIENEFKHDVALSLSLLRLVSSPFYWGSHVTTIREAIYIIGVNDLWRWLTILVYTDFTQDPKNNVLVNTAIIRARFSELLMSKAEPGVKSEMFIIGMFSLLDVLLHIPMPSIVEQLKFPKDMANALIKREGLYGEVLRTVIAFEKNRISELPLLCQNVGITIREANIIHAKAMAWANSF